MKKTPYSAALGAALLALLLIASPHAARAQVEKRVEVTKAYTPSVESAPKLPITPDMTDTVTMRPDIDYTVTPLSLRTTLATRPIRPATVTYWEFNRPKTFYIKAGAGYPLNSVLDFYAASQNPGTGYVVGYINHEGRYSKIANDVGVKNNATQMLNRIGAAAGKYFGRRTLEGELSYENRLYHRYGNYLNPDYIPLPGEDITAAPDPGINYGALDFSVRFGDNFQDLTRFNFELAADAGYFHESPRADYGSGEYGSDHQIDLAVRARVAKSFGRHTISFGGGYKYMSGGDQDIFYASNQQQIHASLRYGIDGRVVHFGIGADYYNDHFEGYESNNYLLPYLRLRFDLGRSGFQPFVEIDGDLRDNSMRSLSYLNPYVESSLWATFSSVDYNGRAGIGGTLGEQKFEYRLWVGMSVCNNHLYWITFTGGPYVKPYRFYDNGQQIVYSFNGELTWRPVSALRAGLGISKYIYDNDYGMSSGSPAFTGRVSVDYDGRKFSAGAAVYMKGDCEWDIYNLTYNTYSIYSTPFGADLRVHFDWKFSRGMVFFVEGRNLANQKLYDYPWYRGYGANFTLGVKANF